VQERHFPTTAGSDFLHGFCAVQASENWYFKDRSPYRMRPLPSQTMKAGGKRKQGTKDLDWGRRTSKRDANRTSWQLWQQLGCCMTWLVRSLLLAGYHDSNDYRRKLARKQR
jgi:hypothetical protein